MAHLQMRQKRVRQRLLLLLLSLCFLHSALLPACVAALEPAADESPPAAAVTYCLYIDGALYARETVPAGQAWQPPTPDGGAARQFAGWFLEEDGSGPEFSAAISSRAQTGCVNLYALWRAAEEAAGSKDAAQAADTASASQDPDRASHDAPQADGASSQEPAPAADSAAGEAAPGEEEAQDTQTGPAPAAPGEAAHEALQEAEDAPQQDAPASEPLQEAASAAEATEGTDYAALLEAILSCEDDKWLQTLRQQAQEDGFARYLSSLEPALQAQLAAKLDPYAANSPPVSLSITDDVARSGCFLPSAAAQDGSTLSAAQLLAQGYTLTWQRGGAQVSRRQVTDGVYNLAEDGSWLSIVYDQGAGASYTLTAEKQGAETLQATLRADYFDALQNPSFELPQFSQSDAYDWAGIKQLGAQSVPGWQTTAADGAIELGNVTILGNALGYIDAVSNTVPGTQVWYHCGSVVDGNQIAELNCTQTGALYQDVLTQPGATMHWKLSHRGRAGTDTMALVIAPYSKVSQITSQQALEAFITAHGADSDVEVHQFSDAQSWVRYQGSMQVPQGQYLTRFFFVAIETATGDKSVGNLLDDVWFSTELPPPTPERTQVTVTKQVLGTLGDKTKPFLFRYRYLQNGSEITGQFSLCDGQSEVLTALPIGAQLTITEQRYDGYETSFQIGADGALQAGQSCTLTTASGAAQVRFVNCKEAIPDTGVLLPPAPAAPLLLSAAAIGGAIFRKKRKGG